METNQGTGGTESENGSASESQQTDENQNREKSINPDDHQRAIDDLHKFKSRWKDSQTQIEQLQSQLNEMKQSSLKEKEDFKSLFETESENHRKTKERAQKLEQSVFTSEKYRAVYPALKKLGLRDEAEKILEMQSLDDLEVSMTDQGRFQVFGVETWVDKFKSDFPFAFESKRPPNVNASTGTPDDNNQKVTPELLVELEKKDPEKYKKLLPIYIKQRQQRA